MTIAQGIGKPSEQLTASPEAPICKPCHVADNGMHCVALGTGIALEHFELFKKYPGPQI